MRDWFEESDEWRWHNDDNYMETKTKITAEDVIAFMGERVKELAAQVPGYTQFTATSATGLSNGLSVHFRAYNEHTGHSVESKDPAVIIKELADKAKGKTESEMLRKNAKELLDRAAALEGAGA